MASLDPVSATTVNHSSNASRNLSSTPAAKSSGVKRGTEDEENPIKVYEQAQVVPWIKRRRMDLTSLRPVEEGVPSQASLMASGVTCIADLLLQLNRDGKHEILIALISDSPFFISEMGPEQPMGVSLKLETSSFRIMELPPEVRNKIYGYATGFSDKPGVLIRNYMNRLTAALDQREETRLAVGLFLVNRGISAEVRSWAYGSRTFKFTSLPTMISWLRRIGEQNLGFLCRIHVVVNSSAKKDLPEVLTRLRKAKRLEYIALESKHDFHIVKVLGIGSTIGRTTYADPTQMRLVVDFLALLARRARGIDKPMEMLKLRVLREPVVGPPLLDDDSVVDSMEWAHNKLREALEAKLMK